MLDSVLPLSEPGPRPRTSRLNVGDVQRIAELSFTRISGMRNQIDFCKAGGLHVPAVGLHRDVMLQQIARLGASVNPPPLLVLLGGESTVHLSGTDREQLFLDRCA